MKVIDFCAYSCTYPESLESILSSAIRHSGHAVKSKKSKVKRSKTKENKIARSRNRNQTNRRAPHTNQHNQRHTPGVVFVLKRRDFSSSLDVLSNCNCTVYAYAGHGVMVQPTPHHSVDSIRPVYDLCIRVQSGLGRDTLDPSCFPPHTHVHTSVPDRSHYGYACDRVCLFVRVLAFSFVFAFTNVYATGVCVC